MAANQRSLATTISTAPSHWRRQFHAGWVHAQDGYWSAEYDRMCPQEQLAYEQGRLLAREAIAAGFPLCIWRGDKAGARPVEKLWSDVSRAVGNNIIPAEWRAPAP